MTQHDLWLLYVGGMIATALMGAGTFDGNAFLRKKATLVADPGGEASRYVAFGATLGALVYYAEVMLFWPYKLGRRCYARIRGWGESPAEVTLGMAMEFWHWNRGAGRNDPAAHNRAHAVLRGMVEYMDQKWRPYLDAHERMQRWVSDRQGKK